MAFSVSSSLVDGATTFQRPSDEPEEELEENSFESFAKKNTE